MPHMQAQLTELQEWVEVDTNEGTTFIPNDVVGLTAEEVEAINDVYNGTATEEGGTEIESADAVPERLRDYVQGSRLMSEVELTSGYGVRSSAPGYLDCTDWSVYETLEEAQEAYETEREETGEADEDEKMLRVFYKCPNCGEEWDEELETACDGECGECDTENITPVRHEEIDDDE